MITITTEFTNEFDHRVTMSLIDDDRKITILTSRREPGWTPREIEEMRRLCDALQLSEENPDINKIEYVFP